MTTLGEYCRVKESSKKEKELIDMDNSVVIMGDSGVGGGGGHRSNK